MHQSYAQQISLDIVLESHVVGWVGKGRVYKGQGEVSNP